jgi:hypothetical protein
LSSFQLQCPTPYLLPVLEDMFHIDINSNHGGAENQQASPRKFPVIELCSEESGTGKTQLLYLIIAVAILPETYTDVDLGGRNSAVVILDTEGCFDVQRLAEVMKGYIRSQDGSFPDIEDLVHRSLQHVQIYQPEKLSSLITTLSTLQTYLFIDSHNVSDFFTHRRSNN